MKRKFIVALVLICLCVPFASSCSKGTAPNGLMNGASPSTSALALYVYDGDTADCYYLFSAQDINEVLAELDAVPVEEAADWSCEDVNTPIYGLEIGDTEGWTIEAAWSDGYWVTKDGAAYSFKYDFESLLENYDWDFSNSFDFSSVLPCSWWLMTDGTVWCPAAMTRASEPAAPAGVEMVLESWSQDAVSIRFVNNTDGYWEFGEDFALHVLLDGEWYLVPSVPGNWGFNSIAYMLEPGAEYEKTYTLSYMYPDLPAGTYRLVAGGLSVEGTIG